MPLVNGRTVLRCTPQESEAMQHVVQCASPMQVLHRHRFGQQLHEGKQSIVRRIVRELPVTR